MTDTENKTVQISIIIVNYNLTESIRTLLNSIKKYVRGITFEVIVVDNNSPDRSIESIIEEFPEFRFELLNTNLGFGHGNNSGIKLSSGKYILLLNPDTYLIENLPLKLFNLAEKHEEYGVIGPRLIFPDGKFQVSYAKYPNVKQELLTGVGLIGVVLTIVYRLKDYFLRHRDFYEVDFVYGSCMFIRRNVFEKIQGFDEEYFLFSEEVDLCYKIKHTAGAKIIYWKGAKLVHEKSLVTGKNIPERMRLSYQSKLLFFKKHYSKIHLGILRLTIISAFILKSILVFRKTENKQGFKEAYRAIIKEYCRV